MGFRVQYGGWALYSWFSWDFYHLHATRVCIFVRLCVRDVVRSNVLLTPSKHPWLLVFIMLFLNNTRPYIFTFLILLLLIFLLLASHTHTTASIFYRHVQAQTAKLPTIIPLTTTSSPYYTTLLLANLPTHIHALPPPNASLIDERAYPQGNHRQLSESERAAWRVHIDAMQYIVEQDLHIALILSGNVSWSEDLLHRVQPGDWDITFISNTTDSFAYAVTQSGARKILYEHGIRNFDREFGAALRKWCAGETRNMGARPRCVDGGSGKVLNL